MNVEVAERLARLTWAEALRLADGDAHRLEDLPDGSVVVHNGPGPWRSRNHYPVSPIRLDDPRDAEEIWSDTLVGIPRPK